MHIISFSFLTGKLKGDVGDGEAPDLKKVEL